VASVSSVVNVRDKPHVRIWLVWWLACFLWSGTFLFIKLGVSAIPPVSFAWTRLAIALAVLAPLALWRGDYRALSASAAARIGAAGVILLGVNYGLLYWGARFIPSGLTAVLQSATPIFALMLGSAIGLERATLRKVVALAAGAAGVAVIFRSEIRVADPSAVLGVAAVLGSSLCVAAAYVWLKRRPVSVHPLTVTTIQCLSGLLVLAPAGLMAEGNPIAAPWSPSSVIAVLYLALAGSVLAFWLNYWLLSRIDASAMLMMGMAEVPIAMALGAAIFGERLPAATLIGAALILAGVSLISFGPRAASNAG
jgi:drug/metabolite transporter (DMT)-like permease